MRPLHIAAAIAAAIALPVACSAYSAFTSVTTAPARVVNKTLQTENIISNYEWFKDVNQAYSATLPRIAQATTDLAAETDAEERSRLRMEKNAIQQACRDLAARYNSNASKLNRNVFKTADTPPELSVAACGV